MRSISIAILLVLSVSCKSTSSQHHARAAFVVPSFEEDGGVDDENDSASLRDGGTTSCAQDATGIHCVHFVKSDDAKSVVVELPANHPQAGKKLTVQLAGIESLDLKSKQSCERSAAQRLQRRMTEALQTAKRIDIIKMVRVKPQSLQADIQVDGRSLAALLQEERLVRAFGSTGKPDWCEAPGSN